MGAYRGIRWPLAAPRKPVCSPSVRACDDPRINGGPVDAHHNTHATGVAELPRHLHHGDDHLPHHIPMGLIIFPPRC